MSILSVTSVTSIKYSSKCFHKKTFVILFIEITSKEKEMQKEPAKNKTKSIAFRVDEDLVKRFRDVVKKSGYSQTFLITDAMESIIMDLERKMNEKQKTL